MRESHRTSMRESDCFSSPVPLVTTLAAKRDWLDQGSKGITPALDQKPGMRLSTTSLPAAGARCLHSVH